MGHAQYLFDVESVRHVAEASWGAWYWWRLYWSTHGVQHIIWTQQLRWHTGTAAGLCCVKVVATWAAHFSVILLITKHISCIWISFFTYSIHKKCSSVEKCNCERQRCWLLWIIIFLCLHDFYCCVITSNQSFCYANWVFVVAQIMLQKIVFHNINKDYFLSNFWIVH